ncbi:MAG: hypothetical protein O2931_18260 [Planctomycetota bacterium]|nr:hypothetical protein [Planctomycetota bacterium]
MLLSDHAELDQNRNAKGAADRHFCDAVGALNIHFLLAGLQRHLDQRNSAPGQDIGGDIGGWNGAVVRHLFVSCQASAEVNQQDIHLTQGFRYPRCISMIR